MPEGSRLCRFGISETTLARLKMNFSRVAHSKAVVVYNCVTIQSNELIAPSHKQRKFILMLAQHQNKNSFLALDVFDELVLRDKLGKQVFLLLLCNHGPETAATRLDLKNRTLDNRIKLVNRINDGELRWFYQNCELLIVPSTEERFGLPVAEGLFCGSRVVCSDVPAFREIGGNACHYFDLHGEPRSSTIVTAVCNALAEPPRSAERLDRFLIENVAGEYATLYMRLRQDALVLAADERQVGSAAS